MDMCFSFDPCVITSLTLWSLKCHMMSSVKFIIIAFLCILILLFMFFKKWIFVFNNKNMTSFLFYIFFLSLFFYWMIIALQNFVVFCQTSTGISHTYTYIPSILNLPPISLPTQHLYVDSEPLFELPEPCSKFPLAIYFTYGNVSFPVTPSI